MITKAMHGCPNLSDDIEQEYQLGLLEGGKQHARRRVEAFIKAAGIEDSITKPEGTEYDYLQPCERVIMTLTSQGLDVEQVAERLGLAISTVKRRLSKAKQIQAIRYYNANQA